MDEKRPTRKDNKINISITEKKIIFELQMDIDESERKWTQKKPPLGS